MGNANTVFYGETPFANDDDVNPPAEEAASYTQLAYCTEYGTWWGIHDHGDSACSGWLPCAYNPVPGGNIQNKYLQFILKFPNMGNYSYPAVYTLEPTDVSTTYHDWLYYAPYETDLTMVQATIQLHPIEFSTSKRKFIHRLTVNMEPTDSSDTASWLYIAYSKMENANASTTNNIVRNCAMNNTTHRYYINRLGSMRRAQFALFNKSENAWNVRSIEVEISQGTA